MKKKSIVLLLTVIFLITLGACETGMVDEIKETPDNDIDDNLDGSIAGALSDDYLSIGLASAQNNDDNYIADEIWAFPIITDGYGFINPKLVAEKVKFSVDEEGRFDIDINELPDYKRFLFVLADSKAVNRKDRIIDFVSIRGDNNLRTIPARGITENIALGNLNKENDEAVSTLKLEELRDRFMNYSVEDLEVIAATDNALKMLKNLYINYNEDTGERFSSNFSYKSYSNIDNIIDEYSEIESYDFEVSPLFYVRTNQGDGDDNKSMVPPEGSGNEIINLGISHDGGEYYSYFGQFNNKIPGGFWTLLADNDELGYFDFSFEVEFDDVIGLPETIIPLIKLNTTGEIIDSVSVKWYLNNGGELEEIENTNLIKELVLGAFIQFDGGITKSINSSDDEIVLSQSDIKVDDFQKVYYSIPGVSFEMIFD